MRELKFRIWSTVAKRWLCEDSQYLQMDGKKVHPAPWSTLSFDVSDNEYTIQQYTGLKDINGKEIYEGDVIKGSGANYDNENFIGEVCYDFSYPCFAIKVSENEYRGFEEVEVIGNIYENPELLK